MKAYQISFKICFLVIFFSTTAMSLSSYLFGQTAKGLHEFVEIPLPSDHDTLVEFKKVYAISPEIGAQYFYALPATPGNISEIYLFTKNILEINGADIENPTFNHNPVNETWTLNDGFEKMAEETKNYYKIVRREWHLNITKKEDWYVQLEVAFGHVFFRAGPRSF
jgi:hypothetical protein